jgi:hypothetical protein
MRTLQIHEDDEGLISLESLDDYVAYPGHFWKNGLPVLSLNHARSHLNPFKIALDHAETIAASGLPRIERVTTGYGGEYFEMQNTAAFGYGRDCALFIDHEDGVVAGIWFLLDSPSQDQKNAIFNFVYEFGKSGRFLIESSSCQAICSEHDSLTIFFSSAENWR